MSKHETSCLALPRFERVKYFYGQLLGLREFESEQSYFFEKHRLHNRYLHGYGVVCGLAVTPCKSPPTCPGEPEKVCIEIDCGLALDCCGNEIIVSSPKELDLLQWLGDSRKRFLDGAPVYLSICFAEKPLEPVRPLTRDGCGGLVPDCVPSRLLDDFCVRVSFDCPPHDRACSTCERPCTDPCLPLAKLEWCDGRLEIYNGIRRPLSTVPTTRIDGISWVHGGEYLPRYADAMMHEGLKIQFSDEVYTSSLRRGVVDVWVIQGGGGRHGDIYSADIELVPSPPGHEFSRAVTAKLRGHHRDRIDPGDRVLIQVRSAFVLDRCCRALDGDHIGGLVPPLPECEKWPSLVPPLVAPCARHDPRPFRAWMSGNGTPAGNFESWFFVADDDEQE